jgi:hypothetical protein
MTGHFGRIVILQSVFLGHLVEWSFSQFSRFIRHFVNCSFCQPVIWSTFILSGILPSDHFVIFSVGHFV